MTHAVRIVSDGVLPDSASTEGVPDNFSLALALLSYGQTYVVVAERNGDTTGYIRRGALTARVMSECEAAVRQVRPRRGRAAG